MTENKNIIQEIEEYEEFVIRTKNLISKITRNLQQPHKVFGLIVEFEDENSELMLK